MALKGNLRDFSTVQLLNLINLARKTGNLVIDKQEEQANLSFKEGKLIYATLNGGNEGGHLASVLQKAGKLTQEQAQAIQTRARDRSDKELGLLLINAGYVSQEDIVRSVRSYVLSNVYPLFTWTEGQFRFDSRLRVEDRITVSVDLENVIMEGSRRMDEWERLQEDIPNLDVALKFADRPQTSLRDINMNVEEWRVVSFINPRNTIRQIAQYNNMSDFQIRKIVYGLLQAGLVELVEKEGAAESEPSQAEAQPSVKKRRPDVKRNVITRLIDRIKEL
jgi:hypothetical protein